MHAEGYAANKMKHGPIALIDPTFATIAIAVHSKTYDKMLGNIREVKARSGKVVAIANTSDSTINNYADKIISIPETDELSLPRAGGHATAVAGILCRARALPVHRPARTWQRR